MVADPLGGVHQELVAGIDRMIVYGGAVHPAPHKALLVLWAVRRRQALPRAPRLFRYDEVDVPLRCLLKVAGRRPRPWLPFVRLAREPFWDLHGTFPVNEAGDVRSARHLREDGIVGGFRERFNRLLADPDRATTVEKFVVTRWLPEASRRAVLHTLQNQFEGE